jgi:hypothetical protein
MKTKRIRTVLCVVITAITMGMWAADPGWAGDSLTISTTTGVVTSLDEERCVLVIYGSMDFYPAEKVAKKYQGERGPFPDWVKVGSKVSLSYYVFRGNRFFLDVVKPGEALIIKKELEEAQNTAQ